MNGNGNENGNGMGNGRRPTRGGSTIIVDWVTGLLAAAAAFIFMGYMAWSIGALSLWIITIAILVMMVVDIVQGAMNRSGSQG